MADRRAKNKVCPNEKDRPNDLSHLRSFSSSRQHRRNISNLNTNLFSNDNYISSSITLPVSVEYDRNSRHPKKSAGKQYQQLLAKNHKASSSEKQADKRSKNAVKGSRSNQKAKKSTSKNNQQPGRHKNSPIKIITDSAAPPDNLKIHTKKRSSQKMGKESKQKLKAKNANKNRPNLSVGVRWQQIIEQYAYCLSVSQMAEIKEYKWIYFLGKIRQRTHKKQPNDQILSARGYPRPYEQQQQQKLNQLDYFTQLKTNPPANSRIQSTEDEFYKYETGDHIAYRYEIVHCINRGSFGQVLKVYDHKSKEHLALKIVKKCQELVQQTFEEISILTQIKERDKANISGVVRIKDFTIFRNHICILFELLNGNLYELLAANSYKGLGDDIIRIFAVQILNSLQFLEKERVIHCDIKPENIVMKTWGKSGIKLVDFGTSCFEGKQLYQYLQSRYYRAPQIMLRKPYSFPIDMWSLGCLLAELKIGEPVFAATNNIEQLMYISNSIGYPKPEDGPYSCAFLDSAQFKELVANNYIGQYRRMLQSVASYSEHSLFSKCKYLHNCMQTLQQRLLAKQSTKDNTFVEFLMKILVWEPSKRLKPLSALQETWIVRGLPQQIKELYTVFNSEASLQYKTFKNQQPHPLPNRSKSHSKKARINILLTAFPNKGGTNVNPTTAKPVTQYQNPKTEHFFPKTHLAVLPSAE